MPSTPAASGPGLAHFGSAHYQRHNCARLRHLESLGLPLANTRVLELGSGPGDHTQFYVERGCRVVSVDARQECLDALAQRFPEAQTVRCDLNEPEPLSELGAFDVVHCYGILYHLEDPGRLLRSMGEVCAGFVIVETCVSRENAMMVETVEETREDYTQSFTGRASRPSRQWVFEKLRESFPFVYQTRTQPVHPEFPLNWNDLSGAPPLIRAVFVASKHALELPSLSSELLDRQFPATAEGLQAGMEDMQRLVWQCMGELEAKEQALQEMRLEAERRLEALQAKQRAQEEMRHEGEQRLEALHAKEQALQEMRLEAEQRLSALEASTAANEELRQRAAILEAAAEERLQALLDKEQLIGKLDAALKRHRGDAPGEN